MVIFEHSLLSCTYDRDAHKQQRDLHRWRWGVYVDTRVVVSGSSVCCVLCVCVWVRVRESVWERERERVGGRAEKSGHVFHRHDEHWESGRKKEGTHTHTHPHHDLSSGLSHLGWWLTYLGRIWLTFLGCVVRDWSPRRDVPVPTFSNSILLFTIFTCLYTGMIRLCEFVCLCVLFVCTCCMFERVKRARGLDTCVCTGVTHTKSLNLIHAQSYTCHSPYETTEQLPAEWREEKTSKKKKVTEWRKLLT